LAFAVDIAIDLAPDIEDYLVAAQGSSRRDLGSGQVSVRDKTSDRLSRPRLGWNASAL